MALWRENKYYIWWDHSRGKTTRDHSAMSWWLGQDRMKITKGWLIIKNLWSFPEKRFVKPLYILKSFAKLKKPSDCLIAKCKKPSEDCVKSMKYSEGFVKLEKPRKFYEKSRLFFRKIREIFQNIQKALIKFVKSENPRFAIKKT